LAITPTAHDPCVAADHLARQVRLEFIDGTVIHDRAEQLVHVVRHAVIGGQEIVQSIPAAARVSSPVRRGWRGLRLRRQSSDQIAQLGDTGFVVVRRVVRDSTYLGVRHGAAERLGVDALAGRALHEIRPAESHERRSLHHHDDVRKCREIRASRDARTHHRGQLRNSQITTHDRVVVEEPARAVLPGKHAALIRQVHAGRVHQVDDRDVTAHRDLLGAQHLLDRFRPPRAGFHRRIVRDDDHAAAFDGRNARDDAGGGCLTVVLVIGDEQSDLEKARAGITEQRDALARRQLSLFVLPRNLVAAAALLQLCLELSDFVAQLAKPAAHASCRSRSANQSRI
jgi:hypothetical protein